MGGPPTITGIAQPRGSRTWLRTLGWACYLACSWTWCIGMFLPVLLVRDYGIWGFVVFAVPNVVGAAAFGWVLRKPGASEAVVARHGAACRAFSLVTIAFQLFFLAWLGSSIDEQSVLVTAVPVTLSSAAAIWCLLHPAWWGEFAIAALAVSLAAFAQNASTGDLFVDAHPAAPMRDETPALALVCCLGFLLCPYLDPTFHRARRALPAARATAAFVLAFGAFFAVMIAYSLGYAMARGDWLAKWLTSPDRSLAGTMLVLHIVVQLSFTIWAHIRESPPGRGRMSFRLGVVAVVFALCAIGPWAPLPEDPTGELVYRLFMSFYGLAFPAYVWVCMIPTRQGHTGVDGPAGRRRLVVWTIAVAVAAPAYWMGFIERQTWWLVPGVAIVLLARLFVPGGVGFGRLRPGPSGPSEPETQGGGTGPAPTVPTGSVP